MVTYSPVLAWCAIPLGELFDWIETVVEIQEQAKQS